MIGQYLNQKILNLLQDKLEIPYFMRNFFKKNNFDFNKILVNLLKTFKL